MIDYIIRRLLLVIPTLLGIMLVNFAVIQFAPGGPVEKVLAEMAGIGSSATARIDGSAASEEVRQDVQASNPSNSGNIQKYRGAQGLDPELIARLEKQFGLDKPAHERFLLMLGNYLTFDFGESFFRSASVVDLVLEKLPVSISLGLTTTLLIYWISIPLGIAKAVRDGTRFDVWTSAVVIIGYSIPSFIFAILLVVLFAGGSYWDIFPLRGLTTDNWDQLSWIGKAWDWVWHMILPVTAMLIGGFATSTLLTKNSFLEEINKQYVVTARAKGLTDRAVLYGHVFRNAMIIVIAGIPGALVGILFTGSLLIEVIFSLDGLGLLGFEAVINRDYPIIFATLYFFTLIGLLLTILSDILKTIVDPRIDFEGRG